MVHRHEIVLNVNVFEKLKCRICRDTTLKANQRQVKSLLHIHVLSHEQKKVMAGNFTSFILLHASGKLSISQTFKKLQTEDLGYYQNRINENKKDKALLLNYIYRELGK